MVRLLLALLALCVATTAAAQTRPPDVPAYVNTVSGILYRSGTTQNKLGNGIDPDGGTPPAAAYELADVPYSPTGRAQSEALGEGYFCTLIIFGGTCDQAKARFAANFTHILFDDPIRNYAAPGTSHCHAFFGNGSANAFSTFASLRKNADKYSAAAGAGLNGTAYWMPCMIKPNAFGDGKDYAIRPNLATFYYTASNLDAISQNTYLLLGLRYVSGYNMDDGSTEPLGAWLAAKVAEANAQSGTSGRYSIYHAGFNPVTWNFVCVDTGETLSHKLANADGSGSFTTPCPTSSRLQWQFSGPSCWDGINLWSPGGYKHVIPPIYDNVYAAFVCPNGWYKIPELQILVDWSHNGPADYTTWKFASDGPTAAHGSTSHSDWMNGWDRTTLHLWMDNCLGVGATAHECNDSTVSPNLRLFTAEAGPYRNPQVSLSERWGTTVPGNMWLLPTTSNGPKTIHIHGS